MQIPRKYMHWLDFLHTMTVKEIRARYKHTVAGFLWVFVNPLLQMVVIGIIFRYFVPFATGNYYLYLFSGLLPWNFFNMTLSKTTPAFYFERNLIQKAKFPKEIIVLSIVLSNFFNFIISIVIFVTVLVLFFQTDLVVFVRLIVPTIWLLFITTGFSLLTSSLNVRFRDTNFFIQAILPLWFYCTPIMYAISNLPEKLKHWIAINPFYAVIEGYHSVIDANSGVLLIDLFPSMLSGTIISVLGIITYYFMQKNFDDWL